MKHLDETFFFVPLLLCASINDQAVELSELARTAAAKCIDSLEERSFNPNQYTVDLSDPKKPTLAIRKFADEVPRKTASKAQLNEIQTRISTDSSWLRSSGPSI
ncbi:MAG: hypothetical protein H7A20_07300 [Rhodanobacteraceae bacterium]|nr:hypothetical protein [Rhodanobacteraceae bacterium]